MPGRHPEVNSRDKEIKAAEKLGKNLRKKYPPAGGRNSRKRSNIDDFLTCLQQVGASISGFLNVNFSKAEFVLDINPQNFI